VDREGGRAPRAQLLATSTVAASVNMSTSVDLGVGPTSSGNTGVTLPPNTETKLLEQNGPSAGFLRIEAQVVYRSASRTIFMPVHLIANDMTGRCQVNGMAIPST
jgi:hypothetical protein